MKKKRYSNTVFFITCVFSTLISFGASFLIYHQHISYVRESYKKTLTRASLMIEAECPYLNEPAKIKQLLFENSPLYWDMQETFLHLQKSMGVSYIYILEKQNAGGKKIDDTWNFLLSTVFKEGSSPAEILAPYNPYSSDKYLNAAWNEPQQLYFESSDRWGNFITTLRPVFYNNEIKCLIGVDYDLDYVRGLGKPGFIALLTSLAASVVLSILIAVKMRESVRSLEVGIKERTNELAEQTRIAQSASKAKTNFLASMSHEIRTPMNAIIGMSELMPSENLNAVQKQYFNDIKEMSNSLLQIINEILDVSKIELGKMDLRPVDFDLRALFDSVCSLGIFSASAKSLKFESDFSQDLPDILFADDTRIKQIVTNLVNNATKYTVEGYVKLRFSRENDAGVDLLVISVQDSGAGIREENIPKLFSRFMQFDARQNRGIVGTGLGLAITKELADMMGGEVFVQSVYGCGSTFTVKLPIVCGNKDNVSYNESEDCIFATDDTRVLVVDDNSMNCTVAIGFLANHHIYPDIVSSGSEAIEKVQEVMYDLVFMDHMMPEMDGTVATQRIRAISGKYFQKLPIIALSANAIEGARELFINSGMNDFLAKPIKAKELNKILAKYLPQKKIIKESNERIREKEVAAEHETKELSPFFDALLDLTWLDIDAGLSYTGGRRKGYIKVLRQFCNEVGKDISSIMEFLAAHNLKEYCTRIHALKSSLANIGAKNLSERAKSLEDAARDKKHDYCMERTENFCADVLHLKEHLAAIITKYSLAPTKTAPRSIDEQTLRVVLNAIRESCQKGDSDTVEKLAAQLYGVQVSAADSSRGAEINTVLEEIQTAVEAFDYDIVIKAIDGILAF